MSRRCAVTGKGVLTGNNVSHSNNKTRRRFLPNLQMSSFVSDALKTTIQLRLSTNAIRSIEKNGGIDTYLLKARSTNLSEDVLRLKKKIAKALTQA